MGNNIYIYAACETLNGVTQHSVTHVKILPQVIINVFIIQYYAVSCTALSVGILTDMMTCLTFAGNVQGSQVTLKPLTPTSCASTCPVRYCALSLHTCSPKPAAYHSATPRESGLSNCVADDINGQSA